MPARLISGTVAAALLVTATFVDVPPASADKASAIISMGDSYISGEAGRWRGNGNYYWGSRYGTDLAAYNCNHAETSCSYDPKRVYGNTAGQCDRSNGAEITHVEKIKINGELIRIAPQDRINIACSGATTDDVTKNHFKGEPPQVEQLRSYAENRDIKVIVLSIGGNDIGFRDIIEECVSAFTSWMGPCKKGMDKPVRHRIDKMEAKVAATVWEIRGVMDDAGYSWDEYRLIVQSYPAPVPAGKDNRYKETYADRWGKGGCPLYNADADWARDEVMPYLADKFEKVANQTETEFLDLRKALSGHEVCAKGVGQSEYGNTLGNPRGKDSSEWVRWIGLTQGYVQESMHPNSYGQQQLGACLAYMAIRVSDRFRCEVGSV